jgi:hypothetical protein
MPGIKSVGNFLEKNFASAGSGNFQDLGSGCQRQPEPEEKRQQS